MQTTNVTHNSASRRFTACPRGLQDTCRVSLVIDLSPSTPLPLHRDAAHPGVTRGAAAVEVTKVMSRGKRQSWPQGTPADRPDPRKHKSKDDGIKVILSRLTLRRGHRQGARSNPSPEKRIGTPWPSRQNVEAGSVSPLYDVVRICAHVFGTSVRATSEKPHWARQNPPPKQQQQQQQKPKNTPNKNKNKEELEEKKTPPLRTTTHFCFLVESGKIL